MPPIAPLPFAVRRHLAQNTHPGLMLDKYAPSWDADARVGGLSERVQGPVLDEVVALSNRPRPDFAALFERWKGVLASARAVVRRATTVGPFTLHLARASALENAGICLHPLYGFVYLPGSGVKGMSHAYACEVWLPAQPDREKAWNTICHVFGWAEAPWLNDLAKRHAVVAPRKASAGAIVFHDAWPETWPRLGVDILNSHHSAYYSGKEPPGDWDSPVPVYFLAVPAGQTFRFAASKRRDDVSDETLHLALEWLCGALVHLGAGAKTASGYGTFRLEDNIPDPVGGQTKDDRHAALTCPLELVTPAFLAGARQQKEDCELRPATLRGLLRWWWRTLHVGFVDVKTLRQLEAAIWGDTKAGGAVRLTLRPISKTAPLPFDRNAVQRNNRLPMPPNRKTTQGLFYSSYGMDEPKGRRWFMPPGTRWQVTLVARRATYPVDVERGKARDLPASLVLAQVRAALQLFCHFGGAGAKSRKGFGSFADPIELGTFEIAILKRAAEEFRRHCGLSGAAFDENKAESPSLEQILPLLEVPFPGWQNIWLAIDQVGDAAQRFAQTHKHRVEKKALGLPRKIGNPAKGVFIPGRYVGDRHSSPILYHFARGPSGFVLRVAAFPARHLPDLKTSRQFLSDLLRHLDQDLPHRVQQHAADGKRPAVHPTATTGPATGTSTVAGGPKAGDRVDAELLAEKTKKGGWQAKHLASGKTGPIVNSADVPGDAQAGAKLTLIVSAVTPTMSFRYPTKADEEKAKTPKSSGKPPRK